MNNLESINGVGEKTVKLLNKLKIYTKEDLICYYPYRYNILRKTDMNTIQDKEPVTIDGIIEGIPTLQYLPNRKKKIIFRINTNTHLLNIHLFNPYQYKDLKPGLVVTVIGKYNKIKNCIEASEIRLEPLPNTPIIEPIYHLTEGLTQKNIIKYIKEVLNENIKIENYIPDIYMTKYKFKDKIKAIQDIHTPNDVLSYKKSKQQLKYEELYNYLYKISNLRNKEEKNNGIERNINIEEVLSLTKNLSFKLTEDQLTSIKEIINDMNNKKQMNRLVQGDVGSGKTIVSFLSIYGNYLSHYQSALMAPTSILATQHYNDAIKLFDNTNIKIKLLTSNTNTKEKTIILKELKEGEIDLLIGTHSLIQDNVEYNNLGLVIIDEQHRFGVKQREDIKNKGKNPDVLLLSATPIPRTYALTLYGDIEVSNIKTKPQGRKEIKTYLKSNNEITEVLNMMKKEIDEKRQIYVIAPSIEEEDTKESVIELTNKMTKAFGKIAKVGTVHGKLDEKEKDFIMEDFKKHNLDILISTTVIEVGVNVPNASMIVIFNANYFGLASLHQLRGRVGRGDIQSYCILVSKEKQERLKMLETCNDGFKISEYDFKMRKEGDLFGTRQSGEIGLVLADITRDYELLLRVREDLNNYIK